MKKNTTETPGIPQDKNHRCNILKCQKATFKPCCNFCTKENCEDRCLNSIDRCGQHYLFVFNSTRKTKSEEEKGAYKNPTDAIAIGRVDKGTKKNGNNKKGV